MAAAPGPSATEGAPAGGEPSLTEGLISSTSDAIDTSVLGQYVIDTDGFGPTALPASVADEVGALDRLALFAAGPLREGGVGGVDPPLRIGQHQHQPRLAEATTDLAG